MTLKLTALSGGELDTLTRRTFILGVEHTDLSGDVSVRPQVVDMTGVHVSPVPLPLLTTGSCRGPTRARRLMVIRV